MKARLYLFAVAALVLCMFIIQIYLFNINEEVIENEHFSVAHVSSQVADDDDFYAGMAVPMPSDMAIHPGSLMEYYNTIYRTETLAPVVSIITPVYNFNETKIQATVAAIQHQSLQNWEWIIVDDAVVENVYLKAFLEDLDDTRIRLLRNGHLGLPGARNYAISESKGIYYYPLDDDDLIEHNALELLFFSLAANPSASFANGYSYGFGSKNYKWARTYGKAEGFLSVNLGTYAIMARKDHWLKVGGYDTERTGGMEDWDYTLKLMDENMWGFTVPEFVFWYRTRATHTDRWTGLSEDGLKAFIKDIPRRYPNLKARRFPKLPCPSYSLYQPIETGVVQQNGVTLAPLPKTKQRLMLIVPWLIVGGADKFNRDFVRGIVAAGWEVTIVATLKTEHTWRASFAQYTSDIFILSNFLPYAHYPRFLRHLLHTRNPDVVMTSNSGLGYNLIPFLTSSCPQAVFVDYAHAEHMSFFHGGWARMAKGLAPWYDINFVASTHLRTWMIDGGVPEEKVKTLHVGVIVDDYGRNFTAREKLRKELKVSPGTTVVTLAARLDAMKQPMIICKVASDIMKTTKHRALHFIVAGDGDQKRPVENCVSEHGVQAHFSFLGYVSIERMKAVMSASDVLFLSSQMEGIPCVFYEAMAARIPVIGPGVGGISELVLNEVTGYVVDVKNGTEFDYTLLSVPEQTRRYTRALKSLLDDPSLMKRMGEAGEDRIKAEFSIEKIVQEFVWAVTEKKLQKERERGDEVEGGQCRVRAGSVSKLNEEASMGLAQGTLHMDTSPAYCPFS